MIYTAIMKPVDLKGAPRTLIKASSLEEVCPDAFRLQLHFLVSERSFWHLRFGRLVYHLQMLLRTTCCLAQRYHYLWIAHRASSRQTMEYSSL